MTAKNTVPAAIFRSRIRRQSARRQPLKSIHSPTINVSSTPSRRVRIANPQQIAELIQFHQEFFPSAARIAHHMDHAARHQYNGSRKIWTEYLTQIGNIAANSKVAAVRRQSPQSSSAISANAVQRRRYDSSISVSPAVLASMPTRTPTAINDNSSGGLDKVSSSGVCNASRQDDAAIFPAQYM